MSEGVVARAVHPLSAWSVRALLAGIALLAVGTLLVILGVSAAGAFMPGVVVLDLALLLLAASLVLYALIPDA